MTISTTDQLAADTGALSSGSSGRGASEAAGAVVDSLFRDGAVTRPGDIWAADLSEPEVSPSNSPRTNAPHALGLSPPVRNMMQRQLQ